MTASDVSEENIALMVCLRIFPRILEAVNQGSKQVVIPRVWIDPVTLNILKYRFGFDVVETNKDVYVLTFKYKTV